MILRNTLFTHIPCLETDRLFLREIKKADVKDIYDYSSRPITTEYLLWETHQDYEYTKRFIDLVISKYRSGEYYDWALVLKENGKMIGTCGFSRIDEDNRVCEIGYVINPDYWNQGYATEALNIVINYSFEKLGMHRVESRFMIGNIASLAVMKKAGMTFEGYQRDSIYVKGKYRTVGICSILRHEYKVRNS